MAVKDDVKQWLKDNGVWEKFWKRRDELKAGGRTPSQAQRAALAEFHHPDGEPVESMAGDSASGSD